VIAHQRITRELFLRGEVLEEHGLRRRVVATTAQFMAIPMMLKQAPAIATLPARFGHFCANAWALATSPLPFPSPTFAVSMVWHRRDAGSPSIAWLRDRIRAAASSGAGSQTPVTAKVLPVSQ
jgi:DNA-binding transcriptional LysR family regulator